MIDAPTNWLVQQICQNATAHSLWLSDENILNQLPSAQDLANKPTIITNRWDIAQQAATAGFHAQFSDFDFSAIRSGSLEHIFYRISKEKAVTHYLINQAHNLLKPGGTLWLCGQKNEGIKTYIEKASTLFGCTKHIQKNGLNYYAHLTKTICNSTPLTDEDYGRLRESFTVNNQVVLTKPGQFGWNKIDQGSEFLIAQITPFIAQTPIKHCLDLGCGYGYLSIASKDLPISLRTLTDNNAAALASASANCAHLKIAAQVIASDAGAQLNERYDLILCNPPFHQGFSVDGDLTDKFLTSTHKLLSDQGVAYFVVNQFIALEKKASPLFKQVRLIAQNKSFKVVALSKI